MADVKKHVEGEMRLAAYSDGYNKGYQKARCETARELLEVLHDVIHQACWVDKEGGYYDSMALSSYAWGIETLVKHGVLELDGEPVGRRWIARPKKGNALS